MFLRFISNIETTWIFGHEELNNLDWKILNGDICVRFQSINQAIKLKTLFYDIDPDFI